MKDVKLNFDKLNYDCTLGMQYQSLFSEGFTVNQLAKATGYSLDIIETAMQGYYHVNNKGARVQGVLDTVRSDINKYVDAYKARQLKHLPHDKNKIYFTDTDTGEDIGLVKDEPVNLITKQDSQNKNTKYMVQYMVSGYDTISAHGYLEERLSNISKNDYDKLVKHNQELESSNVKG